MSTLRLYARFEKIDEEQRMVYGYASTEAKDTQGEIVKREAVAAALPEFMQWGNIREMHQNSAVGKAKEAEIDARGLWLGAKIVDEDAWVKVTEGVYNGFSIAGRVTARDPAQPHVITGCTLSEISLVDRPANPEAVFAMYKADGIAMEDTRPSAPDQARAQAIHDQAVELGAICGAEVSVAKRGGDAVALLERRITELSLRLAALEAEPAPPRGSLRTVSKADDLGRPDLAAGPATVHDMIKSALRRPQRF